MGFKTVLFLALFVVACTGALILPVLGVLGYVAHYSIGPERQWWTTAIRDWGVRYAYVLAVFTAIGFFMHLRELRYGKKIFERQEILVLAFLAVVWFSTLVGEPTKIYTTVDHPSVKMLKVAIFGLMMTHIITTEKRLQTLLWVIIACALIMGLQAYTTPYSQFYSGRLETVGGVDFHDANFLGAYLVAILPLIGMQFMRSGLIGKLFCVVSGVFVANAIILTRSRGAFVGLLAAAVWALFRMPKNYRARIALGLILAGIGFYCLTNPGYVQRTATTFRSEEERDRSAQSRIEIWQGGIAMLASNPLGVGAGNFQQNIGRYSPMNPDRDAHSTYIRCMGELGIPGILVFALIIFNAIWMLIKRGGPLDLPTEARDRLNVLKLAMGCSLFAILGCAITMTVLYHEFVWWFLLFPVCLQRVMVNLKEDLAVTPKKAEKHPVMRKTAEQLIP